MVPPLVTERFQGNLSLLSFAQIFRAREVCLRLLTQAICFALALLEEMAVRSIEASRAIIAMTTNNSIRVKAWFCLFILNSQARKAAVHAARIFAGRGFFRRDLRGYPVSVEIQNVRERGARMREADALVQSIGSHPGFARVP